MPPSGRIGVAARRVGLRLRIGRAFHHALIGMLLIDREMLVPALGEEGIKLLLGGARRMDVAIGDRDFAATFDVGLGTITDLDVHGVVSFDAGRLKPDRSRADCRS